MRIAPMAALTFCALMPAVVGCSKMQTQLPNGARNAWTRAGELRIAGRQDPDNLNPLLGTQTVDTDLSMFWAGYLFNWSDRNRLVPELAEREPTLGNGDIDKRGLQITYHLRRGVTWQDGAPFSSDDVIYTWRQMLNSENLIVSRGGYDRIAAIERRDAHTIVVHLKTPASAFVSTFFTMSNHSDPILPKHLLAGYRNLNRIAFNERPIGTGPFRVASYERGSKIVFVANEHYWRGPPKLRRVEYNFIPNDNTSLAMLQSHQIDFFYRAPEAMASSVRDIPGTRISLAPLTRFADLGLNGGSAALRDVRVRQALAYAIDKRALIDKVTHGIALPGNTDQPPFFWAYNPAAPKYNHDPAAAAKLLNAAGWLMGTDDIRRKSGEALHLSLVGFTGSATATAAEVIVQEQWREAGIQVSIKNYPSSQLYATLGMGGIEQSGKFDVAFENWANGTDPDDSILIACGMAPPAGWNIYHFCNRDVDAAEQTALTHYDRGIRRRQYARIQQIAGEQMPFIVLWYYRQFDVINTDLKNYRPAHAVTPFWNTWEWSI